MNKRREQEYPSGNQYRRYNFNFLVDLENLSQINFVLFDAVSQIVFCFIHIFSIFILSGSLYTNV
jgi:hypothetical protein